MQCFLRKPSNGSAAKAKSAAMAVIKHHTAKLDAGKCASFISRFMERILVVLMALDSCFYIPEINHP